MMFKKFAALCLVLCLVSGTVAFAAEGDNTITTNGGEKSTQVTYTVAENREFIVTIPPTVELTTTGDSMVATGTLNITLNASKVNAPFTIILKLAASNNFKLSLDANEISYKVLNGATELVADSEIFKWEYSANVNNTQPPVLNLEADFTNCIVAGEYSGPLTFAVTTNIPGTGVDVTIDPGWEGGFDVNF